ncbi:MAG: PhoH family protein [Slackia sp.]|nr:PhoH family protein [Slackia sp.]
MERDTCITFPVSVGVDMAALLGVSDCVLRAVRESFSACITVGDRVLSFEGDEAEVQALALVFGDLVKMVEQGGHPNADDARRAVEAAREGQYAPAALRDDVLLSCHGRVIRPKTAGQKRYIDAIRSHSVTFGIGPAGTGKTYLAMAAAVAALKRRDVGRIVLTRPVVEAGENLGFLPGTLTEKVDPYIRPLYDALFDMLDPSRCSELIEGGVVEIAPLAFMRGRTFNDSFVILDEAQNTTPEQMKMFLTRLGFNSKMVVTGDASQSDLAQGVSGLKSAQQVLEGLDDIAFCRLGGRDVVRCGLVARIVEAYERANRASEHSDRRRRACEDGAVFAPQ